MKKIAAALCLASAPAMACNQGDITGRWNFMVQDFSCLMTFAADGKITGGNCLQMAEDPSNAGNREPIRGRLKMQADCRVTGKLNTTDREGRKIVLSFGQTRMALSRETLLGLVHVGRGPSGGLNVPGADETITGDYERFLAVFVE